MKRLTLIVILSAALISACAPVPYHPVIDSGVGLGSYEADLANCNELAQQRPVANAAAGGAAAGALFAALLGAAVGLRGDQIGHVAAWGLASGAAQGAIAGSAQQQAIVANCMLARGYQVVAP